MNQDIAKSKKQSETYHSALNMKVMSTGEESTFALSNSSGNDLLFDIPVLSVDSIKAQISYPSQDSDGTTTKILRYKKINGSHELEDTYITSGTTASSGAQKLIGSVNTKSGAVLVTSDYAGWDCFWEVTGILENDIKLTLLYLNNLGFTNSDPLKLVYNFENNVIEKIYFVDGKRQLSSFNMRQSVDNGDLLNLIDLKGEMLNSVSEYTFSSPEIKGVFDGGNHTSGMVQYAYNLYILNGAQTTISPLSELIPIGRGEGKGGGKLNEALGKAVSLEIKNIDLNFTHIRVYAIKYTSLNESPSISLIQEREINTSGSLFVYDDGSVKDSLSIEQFLFLGSAPIIPNHIEAKDSRLFLLNVKEKYFKVDIDARCYGHDNTGDAKIWENLFVPDSLENPTLSNIDGSTLTINTSTYSVPEKHDSINRNYDVYSFLKDGSTYGAEGKYFQLQIVQKTDMPESSKVLKDNEIYRFGIEFYNSRGTISEPLWLCDLKAPVGNLSGNLNTVKLVVKQEFFTWINTTDFEEEDLKPVGFRLLRATRNESDKTIATQGLINSMVCTNRATTDADTRRVTASGELPFPNYPRPDQFPYSEPFYTEPQTKKIPSMIRTFQEQIYNGARLDRGERIIEVCHDGLSLGFSTKAYNQWIDRGGDRNGDLRFYDFRVPSSRGYSAGYSGGVQAEVFHSSGGGNVAAGFWQMNKMIQMDSPESMFTYVTTDASQKLRVVGLAKTNQLKSWSGEFDVTRLDYSEEHVFNNAFKKSQFLQDEDIVNINGGSPQHLSDRGFYGPTNTSSGRIPSYQILRDFTGDNNFMYSTAINGGNLQIWQILIEGTVANTAGQITVGYNGNSYLTAPIPQGAALSYIKGSIVNSLNNMQGISWSEGFGGFIYGQALSPGPKNPMSITVNGLSGITASISIIALGDFNIIDQPRNVFDIYGAPERNDLGSNFRDYNNDPKFNYANTLTPFFMDPAPNGVGNIGNDSGQHIKGINSHHSPAITLIEGSDSVATPIQQRKSIEEMWIQSMGSSAEGDGVLVAELVKNSGFAYLGSLYGGNSYEDKSNANYIPIGDYAPIQVNLNSGDTEEGNASRGVDTGIQTLDVNNPGDTFVQDFRYLRFSPAGRAKEGKDLIDFVEIVYIKVESTIDLNNRSDLSISEWNSTKYTEESDAFDQYNHYNKVYSQSPTLVKRNDLGFKFKPIKQFDTKIVASKQKIGGEFIDSWTDFLENETMELDGKYGSINATINFKDEIYAWQDNGMVKININPRVQIPGSDGAGLELGVGAVLNDYSYLSTEYGAINDSSIVVSNSHIYFFDANNSSINRFGSDGMQNITDSAGMHTYFQNNIDTKEMVIANPLLGSGITGIYDSVNRDVYFTFLQKDFDNPRFNPSNERSSDSGNNFTICYNETLGKFVSFFSFTPPNYLYLGNKIITTNSLGTSLWSHNLFSPKGNFYGKLYPSTIDFSVNPGGLGNKTFNNLEYRMESRDYAGIDYPNKTFDQVLLSNDYQSSLPTPLVVRKNIKRRNRDWRIILPRAANSRERIRSPWSRIRLLTNNVDDLNMIAHDMIVSYTEY